MSDQPVPTDELKRLMEADKVRRVNAVRVAIQTTLEEHGCELQGQPQIVDGRIVAQIVIVPVG